MSQSSKHTINDVKNFWESHPLFAGESTHLPGTKEFFEDHRKTVIEDCLGGEFQEDLYIPQTVSKQSKILDLGCGIGFWTIEFLLRGYTNIYSGDLTEKALDLTKKRMELYGFHAELSIQNAEKTTFDDGFFDHINCQGVIHHTPDTHATIKEMARILKKGGTANISVYYKNIFLKILQMNILGKILYKAGFRMKGRHRETMLLAEDIHEITRMYDGKDNPIGKCYTKNKILEMVSPYFEVQKVFYNLFPTRVLPFKIPHVLHKFLSRNAGFMIYLHLKKADG